MRVLIVEDNQDVAQMMALLIEHCGYESRIAPNGPSAVELAQQWNPDAVLLDIGLPDMDGYEVARTLRNSGLTAAKIIALSGFRPDEGRCREAGIDLHLMKPVTLQTLLEILHCEE